MNITLILFLNRNLSFLLNRKNVILNTRNFLTLESYNSADLIGPAFKLLSEGFFYINSNFFIIKVYGY